MAQSTDRNRTAQGTRLVGVLAVVAGLVLLGMCASQWDQGTGSTMGRAITDYNHGDRSDLAGIGGGALRQTSQTGVEGVAGVFWLAIGGLLIKRSGGNSARTHDRYPPPRR